VWSSLAKYTLTPGPKPFWGMGGYPPSAWGPGWGVPCKFEVYQAQFAVKIHPKHCKANILHYPIYTKRSSSIDPRFLGGVRPSTPSKPAGQDEFINIGGPGRLASSSPMLQQVHMTFENTVNPCRCNYMYDVWHTRFQYIQLTCQRMVISANKVCLLWVRIPFMINLWLELTTCRSIEIVMLLIW
jgi:hypothetical protein